MDFHCAMGSVGLIVVDSSGFESLNGIGIFFLSCNLLMRAGIVFNYSGVVTGRPRRPI